MYIFIATVFNWHKTLCKWLCYCCIYPTCVADILLINCWQNTTLRVMISDHWFLQNKNTFRLKTSQNSFLCTYCIWNKLHPHNICISIIPVKQVGAPDHEQLYNTTNANFGKLIMSEKICFVCLYCILPIFVRSYFVWAWSQFWHLCFSKRKQHELMLLGSSPQLKYDQFNQTFI